MFEIVFDAFFFSFCNFFHRVNFLASRLRHATRKMQLVKCAMDASYGDMIND